MALTVARAGPAPYVHESDGDKGVRVEVAKGRRRGSSVADIVANCHSLWNRSLIRQSPILQTTFANVIKGHYWLQLGIEPDNPRYYYKVEEKVMLTLAGMSAGIRPRNSMLGIRNVLCYRLSEKLKLGVVPESHLYRLNGCLGHISRRVNGQAIKLRGELKARRLRKENPRDANVIRNFKRWQKRVEGGSTLKEKDNFFSYCAARARCSKVMPAPRDEGGEEIGLRGLEPVFVRFNPFHPNTLRTACYAQYMLALCGGVDANVSNILFEEDGRIKIIDNDLSFGPKVWDLSTVREFEVLEGYENGAIYLLELPLFADTHVYEQFRGFEEETLVGMLEPYLTPDELDASIMRLSYIKVHLEGLKKRGRIYEMGDWKTKTEEIFGLCFKCPSRSLIAQLWIKHPMARYAKKLSHESKVSLENFIDMVRNDEVGNEGYRVQLKDFTELLARYKSNTPDWIHLKFQKLLEALYELERPLEDRGEYAKKKRWVLNAMNMRLDADKTYHSHMLRRQFESRPRDYLSESEYSDDE